MKIAIAGGSGFVGTNLRKQLAGKNQWVVLTRSPVLAQQPNGNEGTIWKQCDLYSHPQVREALEGADCGIYLVHSMLPSGRLIQGTFRDLDLLLADNFIRAAEEAGLKHIIYLGGLIPEGESHLSDHLASRLEVESVLRSRSVKVTVLRAGLIFGRGGSSFKMLINLVNRLPVMILPKWATSISHSIDIRDIVRAIDLVLTRPDLQGGIYDLGGHEPMSYREMIIDTAKHLRRKNASINFPLNCITLSRKWVALFSGVSSSLVDPLLDSLVYDLKARPNALLDQLYPDCVSFEQSLKDAVGDEGKAVPNPRDRSQKSDVKLLKKEKRVRSIQRMHPPEGWTAIELAREYGAWLTRTFAGWIYVENGNDNTICFRLRFPSLLLLQLTQTPYSVNESRRAAYYISGGFLANKVTPPGRFEFRLVEDPKCLITALHGFSPRLPWHVYHNTQAFLHLRVMRAFAHHLQKLADKSASAPKTTPPLSV
jgi:nucleoside-diphosphate-sugar epimerase